MACSKNSSHFAWGLQVKQNQRNYLLFLILLVCGLVHHNCGMGKHVDSSGEYAHTHTPTVVMCGERERGGDLSFSSVVQWFICSYFGISYSHIYIYFVICLLLFSDLELKPVGTLEVKLVQAKELTNKDLIGKSDPYAVLYVRPLRDRMKTSKTIVRLTLPFVLYPCF